MKKLKDIHCSVTWMHHNYNAIAPRFFEKHTLDVARSLLGCILIHVTTDGMTTGRIVETEAYLHDDPASHSFTGKTARNAAMFGPPGRAYIYFTYGMHYCFNVTTNTDGVGEAVLIRALEPLVGIELMQQRRGREGLRELCNGPAKLVKAMGITPALQWHDLREMPLFIAPPNGQGAIDVAISQRIGITKGKELPYRFFLRKNDFRSR